VWSEVLWNRAMWNLLLTSDSRPRVERPVIGCPPGVVP
jgi:hypothetical protein